VGKRYKEFLIDVITKSYQIVLGVAVVSPLVTGKLNYFVFIPSAIIAFILLIWAGAISSRLEV
jgi:hypothetical protein